MKNADKLKAYILLKTNIPTGFAANSAAHVAVMLYQKFKSDKMFRLWLKHSFRKVTCGVTNEQFQKAKKYGRHVVFIEPDYGDAEMAVAFCPRSKWPEFFKTLKLYTGSEQ